MSHYYECLEHGIGVTSAPSFDDGDEWIDEMIADHERMHAEEARAAGLQAAIATDGESVFFGTVEATKPDRWSVRRDVDGWWVASRGDSSAMCFTWEQAHLHVAVTALVELAADEWQLRTAPGQISLRETGDPLTRIFHAAAGASAVTQALTFLRADRAARARRRDLAAARDRASVELDVLDDHFARDARVTAQKEFTA